MRDSDILVVGSLNMDVIAFTPRFPAPGETLMGSRWGTANGGKGANQAVAAARLGGRVAMLGCVGEDAYGATLREALLRDAIDCDGILTDPVMPTGVALITVSEQDSQNSIIVISGSNMRLTPDHIDAHRGLIARAGIVVCQLEVPLATVARVIETAAAMNKLVILNPAPSAAPGALPASLLSHVGILIPNESEAAGALRPAGNHGAGGTERRRGVALARLPRRHCDLRRSGCGVCGAWRHTALPGSCRQGCGYHGGGRYLHRWAVRCPVSWRVAGGGH